MAEQQQMRWPRVMLGAMALGVLVLAVVLLVRWRSARGGDSHSGKLIATTYFTDAAGLQTGAQVNLDGVTVGTVSALNIDPSPEHKKAAVEVTMKLDPIYLFELHSDSRARIVSLGAIGDTSIDIDNRTATGSPLSDGTVLPSVVTPGVVDQQAIQTTTNNLAAAMTRLDTLVDEVETGKGTIGRMMSDPGLSNEVTKTVTKGNETRARLSGTNSTVGKILNGHQLNDRLAALSTDLAGLNALVAKRTGGLQAQNGSQGENGSLAANLATTQAEANALVADINAGHGAAGLLMKNPAFSKQMTDTMAQAHQLMQGAADGKGTLGKFADGQVSADLTKLTDQTTALATMLRKNPKQYLTIQIRLF